MLVIHIFAGFVYYDTQKKLHNRGKISRTNCYERFFGLFSASFGQNRLR
jgi:hypothetical protein